MTLGELSTHISDFGKTSLSEFFQIITTITSIAAFIFAARAASMTKTLKVSINGRMEKLLEATAEAAVYRGREEIRAEMILEAVQGQSEKNNVCECNKEGQRASGFNEGRLHELDRVYRLRGRLHRPAKG